MLGGSHRAPVSPVVANPCSFTNNEGQAQLLWTGAACKDRTKDWVEFSCSDINHHCAIITGKFFL